MTEKTQIEGYETLESELWEKYKINLGEILEYLDGLRESDDSNMFGATPYLQDAFDLDRQAARDCLTYWMRTFGQRHPQE